MRRVRDLAKACVAKRLLASASMPAGGAAVVIALLIASLVRGLRRNREGHMTPIVAALRTHPTVIDWHALRFPQFDLVFAGNGFALIAARLRESERHARFHRVVRAARI